jgi:hypothetical protein
MLYLAFDLDGTLGNFLILWKFLCGLRRNEFYKTTPPGSIEPSKDLEWELDISYSSLVKRIAEAETSPTPLGIFRPRIFDMLKAVAKLKTQGKIEGVIMYTNNSSLSLVNLVRDVVHYIVKIQLFDGIFHYIHPIRPVSPRTGKPSPNKTWTEMMILLQAIGAPLTLQPENVMFFDDQMHTDLIRRLGDNYVRVNEYTYNPPLSSIVDLYSNALKNSNITQGSKDAFIAHVMTCHKTPPNSINAHLNSLRSMTSDHYVAAGLGQIPTDTTFSSMHMLNSIMAKFPAAKGGSTRKFNRRKQRKGGRLQKSRKQLFHRY